MGFVKAQVNFVQFNRAMVDLQRVTGQTMKQVLFSETGQILKECAAKTKVATEETIDRKSTLRAIKVLGLTQAKERGEVTVNAGWRRASPYGRVWMKAHEHGGRKSFILARGPGFSYPEGKSTLLKSQTSGPGTDVWLSTVMQAASSVQKTVPTAIKLGRQSIGLARQSWVHIADSLGIRLENVQGTNLSAQGIAKARAAIASDGKTYLNGTARQFQKASGFVMELVNNLPYCRRAKLDAVMARAINSRADKFYKALKSGVFQSAKKTLAKYPGLFVS